MSMNIIFLGTTGIHHTLIAAHIYLTNQEPADYNTLRFWNDRTSDDLGYPLYLDTDNQGNKIYCLGVGWDVLMVERSIKQLVEILDCQQEQLKLKPILIRRERLLFFLHRIGRVKIVRPMVLPLILLLLKHEHTVIKQQLEKL